MKVAVEVVDATGLMEKDGKGSSNPFVEVEFDRKRQRTRTKLKDLSPSWNETLFFDLHDLSRLCRLAINIAVLHEPELEGETSNPTRSSNPGIKRRLRGAAPKQKVVFLGHARISGNSITYDGSTKRLQLTKKGLFSHVQGEITISYIILREDELDIAFPNLLPSNDQVLADEYSPWDEQKPFSDGTLVVSRRLMDNYSIREIRPKIAAFGYISPEKDGLQYDLVERMEFLFVHVIKARGLPVTIRPFVEVQFRTLRGCTRATNPDRNQEACWSQVIVFPIKIQCDRVTVTIRDKGRNQNHYEIVGTARLNHSKSYRDKSLRGLPSFEIEDFSREPQWYKLEEQHESVVDGAVMLSIWIGTQADRAFQHAVHSHPQHLMLSEDSQNLNKPMVYYSPKLAYLRVFAMGAKDLLPNEPPRLTNVLLRVQIGKELQKTSPVMILGSANPKWNEELIFVFSEYTVDPVIIAVIIHVAPNDDEEIGQIVLPISCIPKVHDIQEKHVEPKWYNLSKCSRETHSKVQLCLSVDFRYHVSHESTLEKASDFQPISRNLARPCIGTVELGIISAEQLCPMMYSQLPTDAYCVAKYGPKWVRTRTIQYSSNPKWNEQYSWEVFDPYTVITIGVFCNCSLRNKTCTYGDCPIGKVQIRLSTMESGKIYSHSYPLIELSKHGVKKMGEIQLAVRFTCTHWMRTVAIYGKPLLPQIHYIQPINYDKQAILQRSAFQIIVSHLARSQPALSENIVKYMIGSSKQFLGNWIIDMSEIWSARKFNTNVSRAMSILSSIISIWRCLKDIRSWKNPKITILVDSIFVFLVFCPRLIPSGIFFSLFAIGVWNYHSRPQHPLYIDLRFSNAVALDPDELDEELDTFPTSRAFDTVRRRYEKLRSTAEHLQTVVDDIATQMDRVHSLLSWRDPRATVTCIVMLFVMATVVCIMPFQIIVMVTGLYLLNCPVSSKVPSVLENFFRRLPAKHELLI
ncbi:C2 calcium/lipid-binding plant phosphoribosyltransferase family protein [Rhynchospora pubera]|uniref:C2 calcium/lipid-binding plant phosphoribosyltransferase family protein n=1 Tax=Rhynchospora pubera TaxID=906938 RepID=A0AAV8CQD9_9POAL|nr:C2 calcium/lipid-binding plant phosphoribosyltransferase family protein [Rhynchospora pubera]